MTRFGFAAAAVAASLVAGAASAAGITDTDRSFLTKDVQGARYELALAKLAAIQGSRPEVRSYARTLVHDHVTANAALMSLAKSEGVAAPPAIASNDQTMLAKLRAMTGAAFDKAYIDEVTHINAQDEGEANKEKSNTHDPRIGAYIQKFAAMDAKHKQMGENLKKVAG